MNTKPTKKRYKWTGGIGDFERSTYYTLGLTEPTMALAFARAVTAFEFLEQDMAQVLAVLLGGSDTDTAGYVLRALRNPTIKKDLLRDLLEKAQINVDLPETFDAILVEYKSLADRRNRLVHGKWYTKKDDRQKVMLAEKDEHGLSFIEAKLVDIDDLKDLNNRIHMLRNEIEKVTTPILSAR